MEIYHLYQSQNLSAAYKSAKQVKPIKLEQYNE